MLNVMTVLYATDDEVRSFDLKDCRATWRYLNHVAHDATSAHPSATQSQTFLTSLDARRINEPMRAVLRALLADIPAAKVHFTDASLAAIMATEPLETPFLLTDEPHGISPSYVKMHVIL